MSHLRRGVGVLVAILVVVFVIPRLVPTSSALEPYGFYPQRNADSTLRWASQATQYVDTSLCNTCHAGNYATWSQAAHRQVSCETCHGPAAVHLNQVTPLAIDKSREACGVCHGAGVVGRPAGFPQVDLAKHNVGADCVTCHNPHDPAPWKKS